MKPIRGLMRCIVAQDAPADYATRVASAFFGTSISSVAVLVFTFISGVLVARVLGPDARGEYGTILLVAQTAAGIGALSFFDAAILIGRRDQKGLSDRLSTLALVAFAITVFSSLAWSATLRWIKLDFEYISPNFAICFAALIIGANATTQLFSAADRSNMRFSGLNFARVSAPATFSFAIILAWLVLDQDLNLNLVLGLFILSKLPSMALWLFRYRNNFRDRVSWSFIQESLMIGLRLHLAFVLTMLAAQLDRMFAVGVWPLDLLGYYFVAFSAVGAGYGVLTASLTTVLFPYLVGIRSEERSDRISQALRLSFFLVILTVLSGALLLPHLVPLLYGAEFSQAVELSIGLLFALAPSPIRIIVLEAGRSLGVGRPSADMALASFAVMLAGFMATGYTTPTALILFFGLSNVASTLAGARHLLINGDIRLDRSLLPGRGDLELVRSMLNRIKHSRNGG
tara:strand:- start:12137 stop:13510 length:1374 start_codon:yes stop_codon:yes gene_type:complete